MFGLGTFTAPGGGPQYPGLVVGDRVVDLRPHCGPGTTTSVLLHDWDVHLPRLRSVAAAAGAEDGEPLDALRPLPPVQPSGQVFCAGANYYRHIVEMTVAMRREQQDPRPDDELHAEAVATAERAGQSEPFVFSGQPGALCGANDDVVLWGPGVAHDWELEIAVVMGRAAWCVEPEDALDHVAGYTIANDLSTRDVMFRPGFALSDFVASKNRPTFFPLGPYVVPREFVPDYRALRIRLSVNGETRQDSGVDDMIHGIEELVSYLSYTVALAPGDVVLTGSPAGNAAVHGNRWLVPGDVMDGDISGLGRQRNTCVPDPRPTRPGTT